MIAVIDSRVTFAVNGGEGCTDHGSEAINSRHSRRCFFQSTTATIGRSRAK
jgi:hypothetical protein